MTLEGVSGRKVTETKRTKKDQAEELALKYKTLPYEQRITKIKEEIPCSKTTAHNAIKKVDKAQAKEKIETGKPSLQIVQEDKKKPAFLQQEEAEKPKPIEEIALRPPEVGEITTEQMQEQLDLFKDMLRGLHVLILAEGGLVDLLLKGGATEKQATQASDQLYRWLCRRYSVEDLEKWDTILLVASYGTLIGNIVKNSMEQRAKGKKKETKKK